MNKFDKNIFQNTNSSILNLRKLPKAYKDDISKLYSFIYVTSGIGTDDFSRASNFKYIVRRWQSIKKDNNFGHFQKLEDSIYENALSNITYLVHRYEIDVKDVDNLLRSIALSVRSKQVHSPQEFLRYLQYTAEAPALLAAKVMKLPNALMHHAKMQGRATKLLLLIKSIKKDYQDGNCYFPSSELKKFGIQDLDENSIRKNPKAFNEFIQLQLKRYYAWQEEAIKGDDFLPIKLRHLINKSRSWQDYVAKRIEENPMVILDDNFNYHIGVRITSKIRKLRKVKSGQNI